MPTVATGLDAFHNLFGGALCGDIITCLTLGIVTVQAGLYFHRFPSDPLLTKLTVILLWCFQAAQVVCFTTALWIYFIGNFGNILSLTRANWEFATYQSFTVASSVTVQTFYARRVYQLSKNIWLAIALQGLVLIQFGLGIAVTTTANITLNFVPFTEKYTPLVLTWLASEAVADTVIAACMCHLLLRRKTGFKITDNMITRLVIYYVNSGVMTSLVALVLLCVFAARGFHFVVLLLGVPFGGFYTIAMLSNLHTRSNLGKHDIINKRVSRSGTFSRKHSVPAVAINTHVVVDADASFVSSGDLDRKVAYTVDVPLRVMNHSLPYGVV